MDVVICVREKKNTPGRLLVAEGELVIPLHLRAQVLVIGPVVALRPEAVAVPVFDSLRDALPLHGDQFQHRLQRLVVLAEQLALVLHPGEDSDLRQALRPPLVVRQDEADPRLVLVIHQFPAVRNDVDDPRRRVILRPRLHQEHVVPHTQYCRCLVKEFAPFLVRVRLHLHPVLQRRHRGSLQVGLQLPGVPSPGVQAGPDQLALVNASAPAGPYRRIPFQHLEDLRVLQRLRLLPPSENLLKHSH